MFEGKVACDYDDQDGAERKIHQSTHNNNDIHHSSRNEGTRKREEILTFPSSNNDRKNDYGNHGKTCTCRHNEKKERGDGVKKLSCNPQGQKVAQGSPRILNLFFFQGSHCVNQGLQVQS